MPSPPPQATATTPPAEGQARASHPEPSPLTSEPLAKRAKHNPPTDSDQPGAPSSTARSPPLTTLPFDPTHPSASAPMASGSNSPPGSNTGDRPSLPSMAALMSPDPGAGAPTLPAPPNTAAFPPGMHHPGGLGGLGLAAPSPPLQIKLLVPGAKAPTRGSAFAAGYDIYAAEATTIPKGGRALVSTGIACAVPSGTYARVAPRSGLAVKHGIATGAGVVDEDYRGEVRVLLFNHGDQDFAIAVGDRIAQMVLERIVTPEVAVVEQLEESVRGAGGFGSTGGFGGA